MGESGLQLFVRHLLLDLLNDYFAALEREAFVGSSRSFYYKQGDASARAASAAAPRHRVRAELAALRQK
ncbi:hypothetical protein [Nannocystis pusilla]|nr:hypothetical protein [Nannocystis pusilla]